jgi:hypothetical protein
MCLAVLGAGDTQMKKTWVLSWRDSAQRRDRLINNNDVIVTRGLQ